MFVAYDGVFGAKEIHRLGPLDLKIYSLEKTHDCDSTADGVLRLSQKPVVLP